jgi:hypothetical protein
VAALVAAAPLSAARAQEPVNVPSQLAPALSAIPPGTVVLAQGDISGWLFWSNPDLTPVLDPRIEIYSAAYIRAYVSAMAAGPQWDDFVQERGATYALVLTDSPIATALLERTSWSQLGEDRGYVLLRAP